VGEEGCSLCRQSRDGGPELQAEGMAGARPTSGSTVV
jgi:hypothetical protein